MDRNSSIDREQDNDMKVSLLDSSNHQDEDEDDEDESCKENNNNNNNNNNIDDSFQRVGNRRTSSSLMRRVKDSKRIDMLDHFSLRSSLYRYEDKVVIEGGAHQLIFWAGEEEEENLDTHEKSERLVISVRRARVYGSAVFALKFLYTYVVLFLTGIVVVFCVLVFLHYGLGVFLVGMKNGNSPEERFATLLTLLSIPTFVNSLSMLVTLIVGFLSDIWNDFEYFNTMTIINSMTRDWIILMTIVIVPLGTFSVSFLVKAESPTNNMLLSALACSFILFFLTIVYTLSLEIYSCIQIIQSCVFEADSKCSAIFYLLDHRLRQCFALKYRPNLRGKQEKLQESGRRWKLNLITSFFYRSVPIRQSWSMEKVLKPRPVLTRSDGSVLFLCCFAGSRFRGSISSSSIKSSFYCVVLVSFLVWMLLVSYLVYSTFVPTLWVVLVGVFSFFILSGWVYKTFKSVEELKREANPFLRELEHQQGEYESNAVGGGGMLMSSSGATTSTNPFSSCTDEDNDYLHVVQSRNPFIDAEQQNDDENDDNLMRGRKKHDPMLSPINLNIDNYQQFLEAQTTQYVYAEPRLPAAILFLFIGVLILFFLPIYGFYFLGVKGYGGLFIFSCILSILRFVFNVPSLVEAFGRRAVDSLELPLFDSFVSVSTETSPIDIEKHHAGRIEKNKQISHAARRIYLLLTRMTQPHIQNFTFGLLAASAVIVVILVAVSVDVDTSLSDYEGLDLYGNATNPTHHVKTPSRMDRGFMYPSCSLFHDLYEVDDKNLNFLFQQKKKKQPEENPLVWSTLDIAFLSDTAYSKEETTQQQVDAWFGPDQVVYIPPSNHSKYAISKTSSVVFKLYKAKQYAFHPSKEMFVVSIRGTINTYDLLSDMQIWFPAMMFQFLRFVLPFGTIWNDVLPTLVQHLGILETAPSSKQSYETDMSNFVRALKTKNPDAHIILTGHSLGAGIAMIVGGRERIPAVGFSGPNAKISRLKFNISKENLDKYTVNIIPLGDPIPWVDDQSLLTENILCRVSNQEPLGACHSLQRTICEIEHICGSGIRPPLKSCNQSFGYPSPEKL